MPPPAPPSRATALFPPPLYVQLLVAAASKPQRRSSRLAKTDAARKALQHMATLRTLRGLLGRRASPITELELMLGEREVQGQIQQLLGQLGEACKQRPQGLQGLQQLSVFLGVSSPLTHQLVAQLGAAFQALTHLRISCQILRWDDGALPNRQWASALASLPAHLVHLDFTVLTCFNEDILWMVLQQAAVMPHLCTLRVQGLDYCPISPPAIARDGFKQLQRLSIDLPPTIGDLGPLGATLASTRLGESLTSFHLKCSEMAAEDVAAMLALMPLLQRLTLRAVPHQDDDTTSALLGVAMVRPRQLRTLGISLVLLEHVGAEEQQQQPFCMPESLSQLFILDPPDAVMTDSTLQWLVQATPTGARRLPASCRIYLVDTLLESAAGLEAAMQHPGGVCFATETWAPSASSLSAAPPPLEGLFYMEVRHLGGGVSGSGMGSACVEVRAQHACTRLCMFLTRSSFTRAAGPQGGCGIPQGHLHGAGARAGRGAGA